MSGMKDFLHKHHVLKIFRDNRKGNIAVRVVKFLNQNRTPLSRFLFMGSGWVIEFSESLFRMTHREISAFHLKSEDAQNAYDEVNHYWTKDITDYVNEPIQFIYL